MAKSNRTVLPITPPEPVRSVYATTMDEVRVERRGKLDLQFIGYLMGQGEYINHGRGVKTMVHIYRTRAGNMVYNVKQTKNIGTEDEFTESFAEVFTGSNAVEGLREHILEPTKRRFGRATADAWTDVCDALNLPDEMDAEVID